MYKITRSSIIDIMIRACYKAEAAIARDFIELEQIQLSSFQYKSERSNSFALESDLKAERAIIQELSKARPQFDMLLEESGFIKNTMHYNTHKNHPNSKNTPEYLQKNSTANTAQDHYQNSGTDQERSKYMWIVDPIDGSSNFARSNPNFAISIALAKINNSLQHNTSKKKLTINSKNFTTNHNHELLQNIVSAVIYIPQKKEIYWAEKGVGAYRIDQEEHQSRLKIQTKADLNNALFSTIAYPQHQSQYNKICNILLRVGGKMRISGSVAIDCSLATAGKMDICLYKKVRLWDIAAAILLIKEAGGSYLFLKEKNGSNEDNHNNEQNQQTSTNAFNNNKTLSPKMYKTTIEEEKHYIIENILISNPTMIQNIMQICDQPQDA